MFRADRNGMYLTLRPKRLYYGTRAIFQCRLGRLLFRRFRHNNFLMFVLSVYIAKAAYM